MSSKDHQDLKKLVDRHVAKPEVDPSDIEAIYEEIPLTYKERIVVEEICRHGNQTLAGIAIGLKESAASAGVNGYLKKTNVQLAILRRQQAIAKAANVSKEWLTTELMDMYEELRSKKVVDYEIILRVINTIAKINGFTNTLNIEGLENVEAIEIKIIKPDKNIDIDYEDVG